MVVSDQPRPGAALHRAGPRHPAARDRRRDRDHGTRRAPDRRRARRRRLPLAHAQRPSQPLHDPVPPAPPRPARPRAEDRRPAGRPRRTATGQEPEATGASGAAEKLDWRQVNEDPGGPTQSPLSRFRGWHPSRNELAGRARAGDLPYDGLKEKEIAGELSRLSQVELATVEGYERAHEARPVVLDKLRYMRGSEPLPGYDALTTEQIAEALAGADAETVKAVRDYEKVHRRQSVLDETARVLP